MAAIDLTKPVWDVHVLGNTNHTAPSYVNKAKISLAKEAYASMENWYAAFLDSPEGRLCIDEFDKLVPTHRRFTQLIKGRLHTLAEPARSSKEDSCGERRCGLTL